MFKRVFLKHRLFLSQRGFFTKKFKAFTLTELLVVLVIIGILVLLALPNLMPLIARAKTTEAKLQLEHVYTLEKTYFFMNSRFSSSMMEIGFEQEKLVTQKGNANYRIEIVNSGPSFFLARAIAVADFDGDGIYNIWEIDQDKKLEEIVGD